MPRQRSQYSCSDCGATQPRWTGRCPVCSQWNTLEEQPDPSPAGTGTAGEWSPHARRPRCPPSELTALDGAGDEWIPTGMAELDRVLGGGLVASSVTLLAGEPGIGKSTLLLQALAGLARRGVTSLLVSAEESSSQIRRRAARLGAVQPGLWVAAETDLASIRAAASETGAAVVVVDSVQTISDASVSGAPGSVTQVRACATRLVDDAKSGGPAVVMVGHVTKDGSIAGPRVLEHLVDTVVTFDGDRHDELRTLRAVKHRFGPTGELGLWRMTPTGLEEVPDAGSVLLSDRRRGLPGSVVFAALDGRRPLLVEIQALVAPCGGGPARRSASGYDGERLAQILAVLDRRAGLALGGFDVYVSVVGGIRLSDPAADLPVALAVASAATGCPVDDGLVVMGEVGLAGELRQPARCAARLAEVARLGFSRLLAPGGVAGDAGVSVEHSGDLSVALDRYLQAPAPVPRLRVLGGGHS